MTSAESAGRDWAAKFEQVFDQPESAVQARVWGEVFGDEYPRALSPYSYTTWSELRRMVTDLKVGPGATLLDIGCGRGGPGLWVAATSGSAYVGVDIADAALAHVRARADGLHLEAARTTRGTFEDIPVGDGEADGVMSIDALLFSPDKRAAMTEIARVLRPDGRLVVTTWDYSRQPAGRPPQIADHRPLLEAAGFIVLAYDDTEDWEQRQRATNAGLLASVDEIAAESGEDPETARAGLEEMAATVDAIIRRVYIVARKK